MKTPVSMVRTSMVNSLHVVICLTVVIVVKAKMVVVVSTASVVMPVVLV